MKPRGYQDDFEMIYLAHDKLRKAENLNKVDLKPYIPLCNNTSRKCYNRYSYIFEKVGLDQEDIISIGQVYMASYLSLYSIRHSKDKYLKFLENYKRKNGVDKDPTEKDLRKAERSLIINYLNQRFRYCSIICTRKSRSILVGSEVRVTLAKTKDSVEDVKEGKLIENYEKFGYRSVSGKELKEAKKRKREEKSRVLLDDKGYEILQIYKANKGIDEVEYRDILCAHFNDDMYLSSEEVMVEKENEIEMLGYKDKFNSMDICEKRHLLRQFVRQNKNKKRLKDEVKEAKRKLRGIFL